MDIVTLRKLAHKSKWEYGKHTGRTINDIMIVDYKYLVWAYYNLERISFIDEILDEFANKFEKFKRIDKPGKDPNYFTDNLSFRYIHMSKKQLFNLITANRINGKKSSHALLVAYKQAKANFVEADKNERVSKKSLQAMNHGNMKESELKSIKLL